MPSDNKPSNTEEEYFARENAERLRKLAADQKRAMADADREGLRKLHFMRCPKCGMELREIAFRGLQIDRCFSCSGTWLDAGELEKLAGAEKDSVAAAILRVFERH